VISKGDWWYKTPKCHNLAEIAFFVHREGWVRKGIRRKNGGDGRGGVTN